MRVGDVYRINRRLQNGDNDGTIMKAFKNDYPADELKRFIKSGKVQLKTEAAAKAAKVAKAKAQEKADSALG